MCVWPFAQSLTLRACCEQSGRLDRFSELKRSELQLKGSCTALRELHERIVAERQVDPLRALSRFDDFPVWMQQQLQQQSEQQAETTVACATDEEEDEDEEQDQLVDQEQIVVGQDGCCVEC